MSLNLAQILERKRQEGVAAQTQAIQGVTQGQLRGQDVARNITAVKRAKEARALNPLAMATGAGVGFLTGGPVGAIAGAAAAPRGKAFKPLETIGAGVTAGIAGKSFGPDLGKAVGQISNIENINKTLPLLKSAGVPSKVLKPLETYAEAKQSLLKKQAEVTTKRKSKKIEQERARETQLLLQKEKGKAARAVEERKAQAQKVKGREVKRAAEKKADIENRRLAVKEFNLRLSEIKNKKKREAFEKTRKEFIDNFIKDLDPELSDKIADFEEKLGRSLTELEKRALKNALKEKKRG
jgi:hypothetical protein